MKEIKFSGSYWHEVKEKAKIYRQLIDCFETFDLSPYNNDSFNLFVIIQAYPKDFPAFNAKEYKIMRRKTKVLELYLILDYERIMQGTDEENLKHITEVFVKGCETFLKPLKEFKWEEFMQKINETI
jgi:hypothetical protein